MYKNILVAVDGSETATLAMQEAARLNGPGVSTTLVMVLEDPAWNIPVEYSVAYDVEQMRAALLQGGKSLLEHARQQMASLGVEARVDLKDLTWQPGKSIPLALLEEATSMGADLIVIGTHGRRGFNRLFMGSVAEQVVRLATLPVLLVRAQPKPVDPEASKPYSDFPAEELMGS
jgi:nucleotide-binding universal stress UspA family protein